MIWLTADAHLGHELVAKLRGFDNPTEHWFEVQRRWNKKVRMEDTVFHLGDAAMGGWRDWIKMFNFLTGEHHLILGNHDRPHPLNSRGQDYIQEYMEVFESVSLFGRTSWKGQGMLMSHFPYDDANRRLGRKDNQPGMEDKYAQWRLRDLGKPLVHGHTHSEEKLSFSPLGTPQVCVSLDAWDMGPAPIGEVVKLVRSSI